MARAARRAPREQAAEQHGGAAAAGAAVDGDDVRRVGAQPRVDRSARLHEHPQRRAEVAAEAQLHDAAAEGAGVVRRAGAGDVPHHEVLGVLPLQLAGEVVDALGRRVVHPDDLLGVVDGDHFLLEVLVEVAPSEATDSRECSSNDR